MNELLEDIWFVCCGLVLWAVFVVLIVVVAKFVWWLAPVVWDFLP